MLDLLIGTLQFALPVLATIFLGLFFAGLLVELGLLNRISHLSRPLVSLAHLPEVCASSFIVSLGSTVAANSMIARFKEDNSLENREVFLCTMINSIPAYIREIFTYQIPIVVPALGLFAGSLYAMVFMVTAIVKILVVIILGRTLFEPRSYGQTVQTVPDSKKSVSLGRAAVKVLGSQKRIFLRIASVYLLMTFFIFMLRARGIFESMSILPIAGLFGIPSESIVPLTTYVASPVLGISMLGPMIKSGSVSEVQAMIVLMLGSMFMLPIFALRSMVPNYTALFGPRLGLSVVVVSTGISILVRLAFLLAFL
ncbi:MAG TPA: nucleoside recognition domain-containing protein, partial [Methanotrichaceae archaeon]|nr:nucleoside recognition domain-containing protein [Methanotrichaceae archaeon]